MEFFSLCRYNRQGGWCRLIEKYEAGFLDHQHCNCDVCELQREEEGLTKCVDKSCEGCKNLASGNKIRDYHKDLFK